MSLQVRCTALSADHGPHVNLLAQAGFQALPGTRSLNYWDAEQLTQDLRGCCGIVAGSEPYPRRVLEALPDLRIIARTGVGYDAIDLAACDELGIVIATTPGVNHHAVAEQAISMLMALARGFPRRDQEVRRGVWSRFETPRVMGTTLGILGLGRIGQATATRAVGLGMKVVAYEPFPNAEFVKQWNIELVDLDDLYKRADYITLHNPSTAATKHMINAQSISKMKPGVVLINTARGALVDELALYAGLKSGHVGGAGMDVFEQEPLPLNSPLLEFDNVLFSGHIAGLDVESQRDCLTMTADTIIQLQQGRWPAERIVNLKGHSGWKW